MNQSASAMNQSASAEAGKYRPWLHGSVLALVGATFVLLVVGGNVTSQGAGMSVPDWPGTFGQNMFLYPWGRLTPPQFAEHFHRVIGTVIGLLTIGIAAALWRTEQRRRGWLRWLGVELLVLVIVQGVMGGIRVTHNSVPLAIVHGITAQFFLGLTVLAAAATSRWWVAPGMAPAPGMVAVNSREAHGVTPWASAERWMMGLLVVLGVQLVLGALVRHLGAGLALPDFPTMFGRWVPPASQAELDAAIALLPLEQQPGVHVTLGLMYLQLVHRMWALVVVVVGLMAIGAVAKQARGYELLTRPAWLLLAMLLGQFLLGAAVIWSGRQPWVATGHQALGAAIVGVTVWLMLRVMKGEPGVRGSTREESSPKGAGLVAGSEL